MRKTRDSFDRAVALSVTLEHAKNLRERYGITRIADLTYLDPIGIPVINVFVPNSVDSLGVYNGKGLTYEHAAASGLMEALERQICSRCELERFNAVARDVMVHLDLYRVNWTGDDDMEIQCVWGTNLLTGERIAVPLGLVQSPRQSARVFSHTSTNGLASGNNPTEAMYHALFELCERHLWSRVHILAHMWPRSLRARSGVTIDESDDPLCSEIIVPHNAPVIGELVERIERAGLQFRLIAYAPPGWPVAMMATVSSFGGGDGMYYHLGFGCSWSPLHAAVRAITEAVQVRVADISGTREDLKYADAQTTGFEHGKRPDTLPSGRWYYDGPVRARIAIDDLPDRSNDDLDVELQMLLDVLRGHGERCVAYVDLSPPDVPISVARVVSPTLERTLVDGTLSPEMSALLANPLAPIR